jgi:hypothetical protein
MRWTRAIIRLQGGVLIKRCDHVGDQSLLCYLPDSYNTTQHIGNRVCSVQSKFGHCVIRVPKVVHSSQRKYFDTLDRQSMYNVTLRRFRETILPCKINNYYVFLCVCVHVYVFVPRRVQVRTRVALLIQHETRLCCRKNQNTRFIWSDFFFPSNNLAVHEIKQKMFRARDCKWRQNMARTRCMMDKQGYTQARTFTRPSSRVPIHSRMHPHATM